MKTIEGNFDNPEVNQLLKKHFIELRSVSPEGSTHVLDIEGLQNKSIKFWSIYENDELIGCGALKFLNPKLVNSNQFVFPTLLEKRVMEIKLLKFLLINLEN